MLHDIRLYINRDYFRVGERDFYLRFFICRRRLNESFGLGLGTKEPLLPRQNMPSCCSEEI